MWAPVRLDSNHALANLSKYQTFFSLPLSLSDSALSRGLHATFLLLAMEQLEINSNATVAVKLGAIGSIPQAVTE